MVSQDKGLVVALLNCALVVDDCKQLVLGIFQVKLVMFEVLLHVKSDLKLDFAFDLLH